MEALDVGSRSRELWLKEKTVKCGQFQRGLTGEGSRSRGRQNNLSDYLRLSRGRYDSRVNEILKDEETRS